MKRLTVLFLVFTAALILAETVYIFKDATVFWKEIKSDYILDNGQRLVYAEGGNWYLERENANWEDVLKKASLQPVKDLPQESLKLISTAPLILKSEEGTHYVYMQSIKKWFSFSWNGSFETVLKVSSPLEALIACPGKWNAIYSLKNEKELSLTIKAFSACKDTGDVYVVTGNLQGEKTVEINIRSTKALSAAPPAPSALRAYERKVYKVGSMTGLNRGAGREIFKTGVKQIERVYLLEFPISGSSPFKEALYSLRFENTSKNGLGFPLPDGEVMVFKNVDGEYIPVGKFVFKGCDVGDFAQILENKTNSVLGSLTLLKNRKISQDRFSRTLKVILKNLKKERVKVMVTLTGNMMELISSEIKPITSSSDKIVFMIDLKPGKMEFQLTLESGW